jgi:hypothetical protein
MNGTFSLSPAGWSAYLSAAATLLTFVTGILFFTRGGAWGRINDAVSVFQLAFMIPVALTLYVMDFSGLGLAALAIGLAGMLVGGISQALIALKASAYDKAGRISLSAGAAIGVWLILVTLSVARALPAGLFWAGLLAGAAYLVLVAGFWLGGQKHPLFMAGSLGVVLAYPVWAFWLGWWMLGGNR